MIRNSIPPCYFIFNINFENLSLQPKGGKVKENGALDKMMLLSNNNLIY